MPHLTSVVQQAYLYGVIGAFTAFAVVLFGVSFTAGGKR